MSFIDTLKVSLGFEETESSGNNGSTTSAISDFIRNLTQSSNNNNQQQNPTQQYSPRSNPTQQPVQNPNYPPRPTPIIYDDDVITPEQSFYEIVLLRPKTLDDINYIVDQVIEEKNPVILDLSFLEKESPANFKLAGEKIKQMRARYGAQALLLARSEDKNLIIVSPKKVSIVNKG